MGALLLRNMYSLDRQDKQAPYFSLDVCIFGHSSAKICMACSIQTLPQNAYISSSLDRELNQLNFSSEGYLFSVISNNFTHNS